MTNYLAKSNLKEARLAGLKVGKDTVHHSKKARTAGITHSYDGRFVMFTSQQSRKQKTE